MFLFWTLVVIVGLGFRFSSLINRDAEQGSSVVGKSQVSRFRRHLRGAYKQHVLVPAAFSHHCAEPLGWWIVPPRLQSLTILIFVLLNLILSFGHYDVFSTNLYWPDSRLQYARFIGDRTGVMGTANLTLIYLFATRNNTLLWITGWSFETFMQFHRWVARVATLQAIIHSLAYTIYVLIEGGLQHYWSVWLQRYWAWGAVATTCMSLLLVFSLYPVRHKVYELFLFLHVALAVMVLVGMWYHVQIFDGAYNVFLWPCFIVWISDRLIRVFRVWRCNSPYRNSLATYNAQSNVVWLTVPRVTSTTPLPGSYYFLYLVHGSKWFESHPFTLSGWECELATQEHELGSQKKTSKHKINLQFVIRPYNGLTARFRDLVKSQARESKQGQYVRVLIEGPYGPNHNLRHYDTLAFIVGGTGVAIALSYLSDMVHLSQKTTHGYRVQGLHIVWAVRERELFRETFERELKPRLVEISKQLDQHVEIHIQIYQTRPLGEDNTTRDSELEPMFLAGTRDEQDGDNREWEADEHSPLSSAAGSVTPEGINLSIFNHRPHLDKLLLRYASAGSGETSCAVIACCPAGMADATRVAVVRAIGQGYDGIDFYPESYAW